jgi:glycosyltransferase involved in cell wall biosynthesis
LKFSVIIPCFNARNTIERTLASVTVQRYADFEIIVVDDGSEDGSHEIVSTFPEVRYYRQANAGVSAARNYGAQLAEGDWLAFCDADDTWSPYKLAALRAAIERFPQYSFWFHDFHLFDNHGIIALNATHSPQTIFPFIAESKSHIGKMLEQEHRLSVRLDSDPKETFTIYGGNCFKWLIYGNFILPSAAIIHRTAFLDSGGFNHQLRSAEDSEFFLRCSRDIDFAYMDADLTGYYFSRAGLTGNLAQLTTNGMLALLYNVVVDPQIYCTYRNAIRRSIGQRYARMGYYWLSELARKQAKEYSYLAVKYFPWQQRAWLTLAGSLCPVALLRLFAKYKPRR